MPGFWGYSASDPDPAEVAANEGMHGVGSALEAAERRGFSSFFLRPFKKAIEVGAPVIMTGHVDVQAMDPGVPASLSPEVVQGLLRDDLGFEGVAVTDSQGMGPVHAVQRAVAEGRLSEERLADAASRVLALRLYLQRLQETADSDTGPGG